MNLTKEQLRAVNELDYNLQIIACAGAGKTEVITRRIAKILEERNDVLPKNVLAFTFTNKAANSMRERIVKNINIDIENMYVGTIHGYCLKLLKEYVVDFKNFQILDTVKNHLFIERYHRECGMDDLDIGFGLHNIRLFTTCIEKMVYDYDNREGWEDSNRMVFEQYKKFLYDKGYFDFSFLIFETIEQIKANLNLRMKLSEIKYLIVDEYQDIDDIQEKLIHFISEQGTNICVVGDDDQTIYQFRGSNAKNMISFSERYSNVKQVKLVKNFRCAPQILNLANRIIENNEDRIPKKMEAGAKEVDGNVKIIYEESVEEQYKQIVTEICKLHSLGMNYCDMAILVRKSKYIKDIIKQLSQRKIPVIADSAEDFFESKTYNLLNDSLRILGNCDAGELYEVWKNENIDEATFIKSYRKLNRLLQSNQRRTSDILFDFCSEIGYLNRDQSNKEDREIVFEGVKCILDDYDEIYGDYQLSARLNGIHNFFDKNVREEYKYHNFKGTDKCESVQIMTIHKAKGLEFEAVFIPELKKNEFPMRNIGGKKYWSVLGGTFEENKENYLVNIEDERKLFYVAITRAKKSLFLSSDSTKKDSEFLLEVGPKEMYNN